MARYRDASAQIELELGLDRQYQIIVLAFHDASSFISKPIFKVLPLPALPVPIVTKVPKSPLVGAVLGYQHFAMGKKPAGENTKKAAGNAKV